jgi:hypothetical protein
LGHPHWLFFEEEHPVVTNKPVARMSRIDILVRFFIFTG